MATASAGGSAKEVRVTAWQEQLYSCGLGEGRLCAYVDVCAGSEREAGARSEVFLPRPGTDTGVRSSPAWAHAPQVNG